VQKYEKGVNRIGAGRLHQVAAVLGVPVTFFFEDTPAKAGSLPAEDPMAGLADSVALRLAMAFPRITDAELMQRHYLSSSNASSAHQRSVCLPSAAL
jgi:transcriptional regulator with XRE-family HTH domain